MSETKDPSDLGVAEVLGTHTDNPPQVRKDGTLVLALGKEFLASPGEQRMKGQFERWLKRNAMIELKDVQESGVYDDERFRVFEENTFASMASGKYKWNGSACRTALGDLPGLQYLFFLLLRRCDADMTEETAEQIWFDNPSHAKFALRTALGNLLVPAKNPGLNGQAKTKSEEPETMDPED